MTASMAQAIAAMSSRWNSTSSTGSLSAAAAMVGGRSKLSPTPGWLMPSVSLIRYICQTPGAWAAASTWL